MPLRSTHATVDSQKTRQRATGAALALTLAIAAVAACSDSEPATPTPMTEGGVDGVAPIDGGAGQDGSVPESDSGDAGPIAAPFGLDTRPKNATCKLPLAPRANPSDVVRFEEVFPNNVLSQGPMAMAQPPGDKTRWFVATRNGRLLSFNAAGPFGYGVPTEVTSLPTLSGLPIEIGGEGGFLGFAFHPSFQQNGRIYVSWTTADPSPTFTMRSRVGYITTPDQGATFTSYTNILDFDQPFSNHKGGTVAFGRDGMLYLSFGDGGDYFGQKPDRYLARILRIDVDNPAPGKGFSIPADNPFATSTTIEHATFAWGFRNPFRFSIDRATGDVWVGDVGQATWEEIDLAQAGGNYGWPCREGKHKYTGQDPLYCPLGETNLVEPVFEYEHTLPDAASRSITGGVIYRGRAIPEMIGKYIFGDFVTKEIWAIDPKSASPQMAQLNASGPVGGWVEFAEDLDGEVYALDLFGHVYKMLPAAGSAGSDAGAPDAGASFPARLSQTGCVDPAAPGKPAAGLIPFDVNVSFWSDNADKERYLALPDDAKLSVDATSGDVTVPIGGVLMKTFTVNQKRVETRLFVHHDDDSWQGYSYEWLDDQTDAVLLPSSKRKDLGGGRTWFYPSRTDCLRCHTEAAGFSLSLELGQLARDVVYTQTNRVSDQIATFEHIGLFAAPVGTVAQDKILPSVGGTAPLDARARAYLHVNCAGCHRPNGGAVGEMDLRFGAPFSSMKACGALAIEGDFGVAGAKLLVPSSPSTSLISLRPKTLGYGRMPPLGSSEVDVAGLAVLDAWISALPAGSCP